MRNKRICSFAAAAACMFAAVCSFMSGVRQAEAAQEKEPCIYLSSVTAMPGDTVYVSVLLRNNSGFANSGFTISYGETDWEGHWAAEHIRRAIRRGLMTGYEDGTWRPDAPVTRGELAAVLGRLEEGK